MINEAHAVYIKQVVNKPLEALELKWMGEFMLQLKDADNARNYFRQLTKKKYELEEGW